MTWWQTIFLIVSHFCEDLVLASIQHHLIKLGTAPYNTVNNRTISILSICVFATYMKPSQTLFRKFQVTITDTFLILSNKNQYNGNEKTKSGWNGSTQQSKSSEKVQHFKNHGFRRGRSTRGRPRTCYGLSFRNEGRTDNMGISRAAGQAKSCNAA